MKRITEQKSLDLTIILKTLLISTSGPTCERRIKNIPFKPLSERMMEEPFWLGLLAVIFVLGILGAAYTVKKHLPEKFDGLLADGAEGGTKTRTGPEKRGNAPSMTGMFSSLMIFKYI